MQSNLQQRLTRAKELLRTARHGAMATVNADGSPHNSPVYLVFDETLEHLYWGSYPDSLHSQNIQRTGQLFMVIFDMVAKGGLYIKAENGHALFGQELELGLAAHNKARFRDGKEALSLDFYTDNPQHMYGADIISLSVNMAERDADGHVIRDFRQEIRPQDLL